MAKPSEDAGTPVPQQNVTKPAPAAFVPNISNGGRPLTVDPAPTVNTSTPVATQAGDYQGRPDTPENRKWWDAFKTYNGLDRWIMAGRPSGQEETYSRGGSGIGTGTTGTGTPGTGTTGTAADIAAAEARAALSALHQQYATMLIQYGQQTGFVMEFKGTLGPGGVPEITYRMDNGQRIPLAQTPDGAATTARDSADKMIAAWKAVGKVPDPRDPTGKTLMDIPYFADAHNATQANIDYQNQLATASAAGVALDQKKFADAQKTTESAIKYQQQLIDASKAGVILDQQKFADVKLATESAIRYQQQLIDASKAAIALDRDKFSDSHLANESAIKYQQQLIDASLASVGLDKQKFALDQQKFADQQKTTESNVLYQQQLIDASKAGVGLDRDKFSLQQQQALAEASANPYRSVEAGALARLQGVNMGGVPMYGQAVSSGAQGVAPGFLPAGTGTGTGVGTRALGAMPSLGSTLTGIGASDVRAAQDATPMAFSPNATALLRGSSYIPSGSNKSGSLGQMSSVGGALATSGDLGRLNPVAWRNLDDQSKGQIGSLAQAGGMSADQQNKRIRSQLPGSSISPWG